MDSRRDQPASVAQERPTPSRRTWLTAAAWLAALAVGAIVFEGACQIYGRVLHRKWDAQMRHPEHYYRASSHPGLAYELAPGTHVVYIDRALKINQNAIRDGRSDVGAGPHFALLGDSVVFGTGLTQRHTLSAVTEEALQGLHPSVRVLNLGVPGYNAAEVAAWLEAKASDYPFDAVVLVLNLNDFTPRGTVYEGADNRLYRLYRRPRLWSPYLFGKAYYRLRKSGSFQSSLTFSRSWYRWVYEGNRDFGFDAVRRMAVFASSREIRFAVMLLPVGGAYAPDGEYQLEDIHRDLSDAIAALDIRRIDAVNHMAPHPAEWFDPTDHLTTSGAARMSELLESHFRELLPAAEQAGDDSGSGPAVARSL